MLTRSFGACPRLAAGVVVLALAVCSHGASAQVPQSLSAFGLLVAVQSRPSFSILGAGARPAGMGGAFTALADDASAASFNPAGLALLVKPEASMVLDQRSRRDVHAAFSTLEDDGLEVYSASSSKFDTQDLNFASFTLPFIVARRNLSLQLSFHRLIDFTFDSDRRFEESVPPQAPNSSLRQSIDQNGDVSTVSVAAAYQLTQRLSLGLTASRWIGDWTFNTLTEETDLEEGAVSSASFSQDNRWRGWNYTTGLLLRYRYLNIGATYRSPFEGSYQVDAALSSSFATPFEPASSASGTLTWPSSWTVGLAVKPLETWFLTLDYSQFDWDDMVFNGLDPQGPEEVSFFDFEPAETTSVRNTGQWRFGTEVTFFAGHSIFGVRGGYFVEPRPQLLSPRDEKTSTRGFSAGLGWKLGAVSVDLAYQHSTTTSRILQFVDPEELVTGELALQAEGRVDTEEDRIFLGVLYQFETRKGLRNLAHFLFVGPKKHEPRPEPEPESKPEPGGQGGS